MCSREFQPTSCHYLIGLSLSLETICSLSTTEDTKDNHNSHVEAIMLVTAYLSRWPLSLKVASTDCL